MNHDEDTNIEWDIEELKKAYLRSAEEYDKLMKKEDDNGTQDSHDQKEEPTT
tara:strand:- start:47 stop:202 length:156 start_codon:yes stop_codon:yes gene_type:complete